MTDVFDLVVIGSGPAGQKAALEGRKAGCSVALVERDRTVGGACLHRGTIPSKTLREAALQLSRLHTHAENLGLEMPSHLRTDYLTQRLGAVIGAHEQFIYDQLADSGVEFVHGSARLRSAHDISIVNPDGGVRRVTGTHVVIATGSKPRAPQGVPVDHEFIFDSDSILTLEYLPESLALIGGGIIACEYASIFASLGVKVTVVDRGARPLAFLDSDLVDGVMRAFALSGGTYLAQSRAKVVETDGLSSVSITLENDHVVRAEKAMVAAGRVASVRGLGLDAAGIEISDRGYVVIDEHCRTSTPNVYAVGDVAGPPGLASTAMEQGRRAVCHALGIETGPQYKLIPMGIFTSPDLACVGCSEEEAAKASRSVVVGRANFSEIARGHIAGEFDGMLKMIVDPQSEEVIGVGIVGEGATELVTVGQMAMLKGASVRDFVENIFNFPTMAEAYRVAALDIVRQLEERAAA